jgi:tol-pal system protein YbgF
MSESDMLMQIDHLQAQVRDLTGTIEQLQYRNHQLEQQVQELQAGTAQAAPQRPIAQNSPPQYSPLPSSPGQYTPPATGTAQYPPPTPPYSPPPAPYSPPPGPVIATAPAAPPVDTEPPTGRHGDAFNPALNPTAPGAPRALGTSTNATEPPPPVPDATLASAGPRQPGAPLDLSAPPSVSAGAGAPVAGLPPPPPTNPSATGAMNGTMSGNISGNTQQAALSPTLPPSNTPKDEYELAYGYVTHKDFASATDTFRDFLHKYPTDRQAPEAQYWLGESLFQQQHYRDAAEAFLAVSTKYETTARAPDALLRLGQSLAAMGEKEAACASLGEVLRKYPRASASVKQTVDREQKRVHC